MTPSVLMTSMTRATGVAESVGELVDHGRIERQLREPAISEL